MSLVSIDEAVELLRRDEVIGLPTETVYGLAGRIDHDFALKKIFFLKKRPFFDPLIVHISDQSQVHNLTTGWTPAHESFARHFWPGPLTLLLPKTDRVSHLITSGLSEVGVRLPRHPTAQEIISKLQVPLAAPSANLFKKVSPTTAQHVIDEFDNDVQVVDGGQCEIGIESTVAALESNGSQLRLLIHRPGFYGDKEFRDWANAQSFDLEISYVASEASPGQMKAHYQPTKPLILVNRREEVQSHKAEIEALLKKPLENLKFQEIYLPNEAVLAARRLYSELRLVSQPHVDFILYVVAPSYSTDEWRALRDRLGRASTLSFV